MVEPPSSRRCAAFHPWLVALISLLAASLTHAQELDEFIRVHVEQLLDAEAPAVAGVSIAARTLIPRIYEARAFAPAWRSAEQIDSLIELIDEAYREGLDPDDYHNTAVRAARERFRSLGAMPLDERAALDIMLTDSVIRLGYHLRFGKVDPLALDSDWNLNRELFDLDPVETIQAAIDAPSFREFAAQLLPRRPLYHRLIAALAEYRALAARGGWPVIPAGETLRPAMHDTRVPMLVRHLALTGDLATTAQAPAEPPPDSAARAGMSATPENLLYTDELVTAVKRFQARHGLAADGVIGPATLAALNVPVEQRIEQIRASLERARWVMADLKADFITVNIASFQLYLVAGDQILWNTRVQVGRPYRRTPVFKSELTYLVINPTWTVPPTILREDILPAVRRDPGYLARVNIDLLDSRGAVVDPASVDWSQRSFPYRFVQRPGPTNALGQVKFMFPNNHSVYLHDTPRRDLFEPESRAFSSGCIRVEYPLELAERLLGWDRARIDAAIRSGRTETVFLPAPIDILLLYWTAEVDESGRVLFWPDVYGRDAGVIAELGQPFSPPAAL